MLSLVLAGFSFKRMYLHVYASWHDDKNAADHMVHMNMIAFSLIAYKTLQSILVSTIWFALPVIDCSRLYDRRLSRFLLQLPSFQPLHHLGP